MRSKKKAKKKKAKMSLPRKIVFVLCLIVFVTSSGILIDYYLNGIRAQNAFNDLALLKTEHEDIETDKGIVIGKYAELYLANNDIIGWVTVKDTKISYPVMQTQNDPEYYLRRDFQGSPSTGGTPFMDANSDIFIPTSNWMIYGHNMKNGTMFHDLLKYKDEDFYKKHKTFKFDTIYKGGQGTYKVIAAGYSQIYEKNSSNFKYYKYTDIDSEAEFNAYVNGVKALSQYDTGVTAEYGDQLVTLSTCAYHVEDGRFFVVGKRIK